MTEGREHRRRVVTIFKAAEACGVARRTIYYWMSTGKIEWVCTAGGGRRILYDTLFRDKDGQPIPTTVTS
jgi:predicted site-specific integrase-resolvase